MMADDHNLYQAAAQYELPGIDESTVEDLVHDLGLEITEVLADEMDAPHLNPMRLRILVRLGLEERLGDRT